MFFMMGITDGRKDFEFNQVITCDEHVGRGQADMLAECLGQVVAQ